MGRQRGQTQFCRVRCGPAMTGTSVCSQPSRLVTRLPKSLLPPTWASHKTIWGWDHPPSDPRASLAAEDQAVASLSPVATLLPLLVPGNQPALCCPDGSAFVTVSHTGSHRGSGSCHCDCAPETHPTCTLLAAGRIGFLLRPAADDSWPFLVWGAWESGCHGHSQGLCEQLSFPLRDIQQWDIWVTDFEKPPSSVPSG